MKADNQIAPGEGSDLSRQPSVGNLKIDFLSGGDAHNDSKVNLIGGVSPNPPSPS
jgi:hypothetical protein